MMWFSNITYGIVHFIFLKNQKQNHGLLEEGMQLSVIFIFN